MLDKKPHLNSLHILRGVAVLLMIVTHVWIVLLWNVQNPIGAATTFIGGYICFTLFLFIQGVLLGYRYKDLDLKKQIVRSGVIMAAYLLLGIVYIVTHQQSMGYILTSPIYLEEYLLTLAVMPFVGYLGLRFVSKFTLVKGILKHHVGAFIFIGLGLLLVILGKYSAAYNTNFYVSLLFGSLNYHTFPIISYAIIYGVGGWLGWAYRTDSSKNFFREAAIVVALSALIAAISLPIERINFSIYALDQLRWPPTVFFIFSTLGISVALLLVALKLEVHAEKLPLKIVIYFGKRSLFFVVAHILILFILEMYLHGVPLVQSTTDGWFGNSPQITEEEKLLTYAEEAYRATNEWPFEGNRVAYITSTKPLSQGAAYVQINPTDIGTSLTGNDVSVYTASQDETYTKINIKLHLAKSGEYFITFVLPENVQRLVIAFSDEPEVLPVDAISQALNNPAELVGQKLQIINKDFSKWLYRSYSIQARKWLIRAKTTGSNQKISLYLPLTCEEVRVLNNSGVVSFELEDSTKLTASECTELPEINSKISRAHSRFEVDFNVSSLLTTTGIQEYSVKTQIGWQELKKTYTLSKKVAVSEPIYVLWSLDWEALQATKASMDTIESIRSENPNLKIVHMFNPRIWNTSRINRSLADSQVAYIKDKLTKYGDEVALHLHMFRDMVALANVSVLTSPTWSNRTDGYDTPFSAYTYEDSRKIVNWAVTEFTKKGLPRPVTFRAGGWFINLENLRALKDEGFLVDTSGRTKYSSRNFSSAGERVDGYWNLLTITQPYWISKSNQNVAAKTPDTRVGIFEIPDNGADSWAFSIDAMLGKFKENYPLTILPEHKVVTYISHPDFLTTEGPKIEQVLLRLRYYSNYADSGPLLYITMKEYYDQYAQ